jgi:hypothetical protein
MEREISEEEKRELKVLHQVTSNLTRYIENCGYESSLSYDDQSITGNLFKDHKKVKSVTKEYRRKTQDPSLGKVGVLSILAKDLHDDKIEIPDMFGKDEDAQRNFKD